MAFGRIGGAGLVAAMLAVAGAAADRPASPAIAIGLAPQPAPAGGIGSTIVTLRFDGVSAAGGGPLVRLPLVSSNVDSVATVLADVTASDARGPLPLSARDVDAPDRGERDAMIGGPSREWIAGRATQGAITIRYTIPAAATLPPRGPAPPLSLSDDGGATSGAGHVFLLLPPGDAKYRTTVDWDLSAVPEGMRGISSFGEGRVTAPEPLSGGQLRSTFYMAGPIHTYPAQVPATGFFAAWQGTPPFDATALMRWTATLYGDYARFFGQATPPPYGVFLRYNPVNAGGGVSLYHAFITTFGKGDGSDPDKVRFTLAHEMFHTFQPFIEQPGGLESSWFGEGLAVFYQRRLPLRFGLITPDDFLADLNSTAARYYTSIMATVPNSEVPKRFWADTRIRTLPYDRGAMYFATVDRAVRAASHGKQSLDDLMMEMLAAGKSGRPTTNADWEASLSRHLGAGAVEDFHAFLAGRMPVPESDAFGPCFRRTTSALRRYELGFDTAVLAEPKRIVRGLVAGSAAARAGLRDGDEIVVPVPQDGIQGDQTAMLTLQIRRDGKTFPITYLPRGETVQAYQWERVPGVPDSDCKL
jgi:hypothetical protein